MTDTVVPKHPAKFTPVIVDALREILDEAFDDADGYPKILDPFAGVGGIHQLAADGFHTFGVELEPEWAHAHPDTIVGDATALPYEDGYFDAVVTSPTYGNRMADTYDGRDGSVRNTYRVKLGHDLSEGSSAGLQWGPDYRDLHRKAWREALRVLRPGGLMVVNIKNHYRAGVLQPVVVWHLQALLDLGFELDHVRKVRTPGNRFGTNGALRVDHEHLLIVRKASA